MHTSPLELTLWERGKASVPRGGGAGGGGSYLQESPGGAGRARNSSTEILTEGRHGVPAQSLKLGNTGFARSLADERRLSQWSTDIA